MSVPFHTLRRQQWIQRPIDEVFAFFSDAHNLEEITPPWLNFKMVATASVPITAGFLIRYRLRWHGVPVRWTTQIRKWDPPHSFIDVEQSGPFRLWHHTHRFEAHGDRTRMKDIVRYALPLGVLGRIAHAIQVRKDVQGIFDYRRDRINQLFAG